MNLKICFGKIPLQNIVGLENGTPEAKANWITGMVAQDYNDIFLPGLFNNLEHTFSLMQQNSISFKIMYYLDYLYLRKKQ